MAVIVRRTGTTADKHETLMVVEASLPSPCKNISLFRGTVSWGERIQMALLYRFPRELFIFSRGNFLYDSLPFIQQTNVLVKSLESEDGSLDDEDVQREMQCRLNRIVLARMNFLGPFGVNSEVELREKELFLYGIKRDAINAYFSGNGRLNRRQIDEALARCATWEITSRHRSKTVFDQYWKSNHLHAWGPQQHLQLENRTYELLKTEFKRVLQGFRPEGRSSIDSEYVEQLTRALCNAVRAVRQHLTSKTEEVDNQEEMAALIYQEFKVRLIAPPLIRYAASQFLKPILDAMSKKVQKIADAKKFEAQEEIEQCEIDLQTLIDPSKRDLTESHLRALQSKTSETFFREAEQAVKCDLGAIKSALEQETEVHRKVIQAMMLVLCLNGAFTDQDPHPGYDSDLTLNLNKIADPVGFFAKRYEQRDLEALALLQGPAEEVKLSGSS